MSRCFRSITLPAACLALGLAGLAPIEAAVDLELRPSSQTVGVGELAEVRLYAVAGSGEDESVLAFQVILVWDASRLMLWGNVDPCDGGTCPPDGYEWTSSDFPNDSMGDGVNNTYLDGDALYTSWVLGSTSPAMATAEGLWVTTFEFQALGSGQSLVDMVASIGTTTRTRVGSGDMPGADILGGLGPAAIVNVLGCPRPVVTPIGSRFLAITPSAGLDPVALLVTAYIDDPPVFCVAQYVQADGTLGSDPVFRTPEEWDTVHVGDSQIIPETIYHVQAGCGAGEVVESLSSPVTAVTWMWGDVDNNGCVFIDDVTTVINGSQGIFGEGVLVENLDLAPCRPDGVIDASDVQAVQAAYNGSSYPCAMPCGAGPTLDDLGDFVACQAGPDNMVEEGCMRFDVDSDGDVDLTDFAGFQSEFTTPLW